MIIKLNSPPLPSFYSVFDLKSPIFFKSLKMIETRRLFDLTFILDFIVRGNEWNDSTLL